MGGFTCGNFYLHSGKDSTSRAGRERYCSEVIPQLLIHHKVLDADFKVKLVKCMSYWLLVKDMGVNVLVWWEELVKPGIRRLAKVRGREINKHRRGVLNLLVVRQAYLTKKVTEGNLDKLTDLKEVHLRMQTWYEEESKKISLQSKIDDLEYSEKVGIYHHQLHQKQIKKSSILKLETERVTMTARSTLKTP
jgi:hypothetical protein